MRTQVRFLASLSELRIQRCHKFADAAQILHCHGCAIDWQLQLQFEPLAWELPYEVDAGLKMKKKKKKKKTPQNSPNLPPWPDLLPNNSPIAHTLPKSQNIPCASASEFSPFRRRITLLKVQVLCILWGHFQSLLHEAPRPSPSIAARQAQRWALSLCHPPATA